MYYYLDSDRKPCGPFTPEQLKELLESGTITPNTEIARKGDKEWKQLKEVFPEFAGEEYSPLPPVDATSGGSTEAPADLSFWDCVKSCFRQYGGFSGRATRKEIWSFTIFLMAVGILLSVLDVGQTVIDLVQLAVFLPQLAVFVRRLHDTGRSGWHVLANVLLFVVGMVVLIGTAGAAIVKQMMLVREMGDASDLMEKSSELMEKIISTPVVATGFFIGVGILLLAFFYYVYLWIVAYCIDSQRGTNSYGPSPKYPEPATPPHPC